MIIAETALTILTGCTEHKVRNCVKKAKATQTETLAKCLQSDESEFSKWGAEGAKAVTDEVLEWGCRQQIRNGGSN